MLKCVNLGGLQQLQGLTAFMAFEMLIHVLVSEAGTDIVNAGSQKIRL